MTCVAAPWPPPTSISELSPRKTRPLSKIITSRKSLLSATMESFNILFSVASELAISHYLTPLLPISARSIPRSSAEQLHEAPEVCYLGWMHRGVGRDVSEGGGTAPAVHGIRDAKVHGALERHGLHVTEDMAMELGKSDE
ncbi:hypothetical protein EJB05_40661, partial [Eragrostis curvula]